VIPGAGAAVFEDRPETFVSAIQRWLSAPAGRNLLDESALPPPLDTPEPTEPAVGEPGYVVPGVSDMGLDGPSAVTTSITSSGTTGAEAPLLGPAAEVGGGIVNPQDETSAAALPEAGEAAPEEPAERAAREGVSPPLEPADNIAEVTAAGQDIAAAHARGEPAERGDVAGLAETVRTPDTAVATPADVATSESAVETRDATIGRTDEIVLGSEEPAGALGEQPTMPLPRMRPAGGMQQSQRSQRSAPRGPSPRTEGGSRGTGANAARPSRGQSGGRSGGASSGGGKRGHGRKSGH